MEEEVLGLDTAVAPAEDRSGEEIATVRGVQVPMEVSCYYLLKSVNSSSVFTDYDDFDFYRGLWK